MWIARWAGLILIWCGVIGFNLSACAIYVWTIVVGWQVAGLFGSFVAAGFPVASQLYCVWYQWKTYQTINTEYNWTLAVVVASILLRLVGSALAALGGD